MPGKKASATVMSSACRLLLTAFLVQLLRTMAGAACAEAAAWAGHGWCARLLILLAAPLSIIGIVSW